MKFLLGIALCINFLLNIVFPNAFQVTSFSFLILCNILIFLSGYTLSTDRIYLFWSFLSVLFLMWIFISDISLDNKLELSIKYVACPFLWINVFNYVFRSYTREQLVKYMFIYAFLCFASVIILYVLTSMGYKDISTLFISTVNIDQNTGLGFTLHVYGSMLFFIIALVPIVMESKVSNILKIILFLLLLIAIILSGRTALYLILFLTFMTVVVKYRSNFKFNFKQIFILCITVIIIVTAFSNLYSKFFDTDLLANFESVHLQKVEEGGGSERTKQWALLVDAIYQYPLGNGFITLDIIRDYKKTYNYEMLIVNTVARFGILISLLILYSLKQVLGYSFKFYKSQNYFADIMFLGFVAIILSSITNPYLESFSFQWMFFAPLIYFFNYYESDISN